MASAGVNNNNLPAGSGAGAGAEGADPTAQCRPSRRRRLARLNHVANTSAGSEEIAPAAGEEKVWTTPPSSDSDDRSVGAINVAAAMLPGESQSGAVAPAASPVWFGSVALAGRLRKMEDTVSLHPSLCVWADGSPMHFFAVFDGHGGPHVCHLPVITSRACSKLEYSTHPMITM
jgi:protein phosphatase 2C